MKGKIRNAFGRAKESIQRLTKGSREFLSGELDKVKKFSKVLAREIIALFVMAIVAGIALSSLLKSFVFDLVMPFVGLVSPEGNWRKLCVRIGASELKIGNFLANFIFFLLVALIILLILRLMPRKPDLTFPELVRTCPTCGELLPPGATECSNCGESLPRLSKEE